MTQRFHQATACIWLRGARAAYLGPGLDLAPHRNAVAVIALGLEAPFDLALSEGKGADPASRTLRSAVIPPGVLHHLRARGPMAFLYLDALEDDDLTSRVQEFRLPDWRRGAPGDLILSLWGALDLPSRPSPDPRIVTLLRALEDDPDAFSSFSEAAGRVGLRPSRARELIREAVGVPFRRYRLWRRMAYAGRELARSRSLTEAAHAAGFASSAHFSTAFRLMFGLTPSALLKAGVHFDIDGAHGHGD